AADRRSGLGDLDLRHRLLLRDRFCGRFRLALVHAATTKKLGNLLATPLRDRARAGLVLQRLEGRADHVVGVGRADRLGNDVGNTKALEHRAHRAAGDDSGPRWGRTDRNPARSEMTEPIMVKGAAV